jgi:hypothetical protein
MNIIGVEPRLSMLEAEVEQLETGGGGGGSGGEWLWENAGFTDTQIGPKNGKTIHLQNLPDREYQLDINSQAVKAQILLKKRTLDAKPLTLDEQVISVGDLDGTTIRKNTDGKIEAVVGSGGGSGAGGGGGGECLWEGDTSDYITAKGFKKIVLGDEDGSKVAMVEPDYVAVATIDVDGNQGNVRAISSGALGENHVIAVRDLDKTTIRKNTGGKIEAVIPESWWELSGENSIKPKNKTLQVISGVSGSYTLIGPTGYYLNGTFPRRLCSSEFVSGTDPTQDVPAWRDFDGTDFQLGQVPFQNSTVNNIRLKHRPRFFAPINQSGDADITALLNAEPVSCWEDDNDFRLAIKFPDDVSPAFTYPDPGNHDALEYQITIMWRDQLFQEDIKTYKWTYANDPADFSVDYSQLRDSNKIFLTNKRPEPYWSFKDGVEFKIRCFGATPVY